MIKKQLSNWTIVIQLFECIYSAFASWKWAWTHRHYITAVERGGPVDRRRNASQKQLSRSIHFTRTTYLSRNPSRAFKNPWAANSKMHKTVIQSSKKYKNTVLVSGAMHLEVWIKLGLPDFITDVVTFSSRTSSHQRQHLHVPDLVTVHNFPQLADPDTTVRGSLEQSILMESRWNFIEVEVHDDLHHSNFHGCATLSYCFFMTLVFVQWTI